MPKDPKKINGEIEWNMAAMDDEQEWIEAPVGWGDNDKDCSDNDESGCGMIDLFSSNTSESFSHEIKIGNECTKTIRLDGYKLDSDETDHSTGVTLWQAAPRLANYIQANAEICEGKTVLELG